MLDTIKDWDKKSLQEREVFISHATLELIRDLCNSEDIKGLEVIHSNLAQLKAFAGNALYEVEMFNRRQNIVKSLSDIQALIDKFGIDDETVDSIEKLADLARTYVNEVENDEDEDMERDAINNIKAAIKNELQKAIDAGLIPQQLSA